MSTTGLLEGVEYSAHQGLANEEGDETVLAPETSADIVIEEQDGTVSSVGAIDLSSGLPDATSMHYSEGNIKMLDDLQKEARERFPFNSVYPSVQELRSAVRQWSESVGASISHEGSGFKCSRSHAPEGCEKRKETRRAKNMITKEKQRETKSSRCGCKFEIKYSKARRGLPPDAPKAAVRITDGSLYRHTHGCFPCQSQLIVEKKKAGHYETGVQQEQLRSIIAVFQHALESKATP